MPADTKNEVRKAEISPSTVSWAQKSHLPIARESVERLRRLAGENKCISSQFTRSLKISRSYA
jgi:hypothetical protein